MRLPLRPVRLAFALLVAACSTTEAYVYRPAQPEIEPVAGFPGARYAMPPDAPEGEVHVASFGITDATPDGAATMRALHARLVVEHGHGDKAWTVDTREILMDLPSEGRSRAAFANANVPGLPIVTIAPETTQTIDVYFPLPEGVEEEGDLPGFDLLWAVHVGERTIAERTAFLRLEVDTAPPEPHVAYVGVAPYWWWDPFWPHATFVHRRAFVVSPHAHVFVSPHHHVHSRAYAPRPPPPHRAPAPHVPARPRR